MPGTKRLTLKCDALLSTSAFKFNLHRYIKGLVLVQAVHVGAHTAVETDGWIVLATSSNIFLILVS